MQAYIFILFVGKLALYNFSSKSSMNENYSFIRQPDPSPNTHHRNWTDQRLMEIMRKYEKPSRTTKPTPNPIQDRSQNYSKNPSGSRQSAYLKAEAQERNSVLREHNFNVERYCPRQNEDKWSRPIQNDYLPSKSIDLTYENRTPQGNRFRQENKRLASYTAQEQQQTPDYKRPEPKEISKPQTTQFRFFNNKNYEESCNDYKGYNPKYTEPAVKQRDYSPYNGYQKHFEENPSRKSSLLYGRNNDDYTPVKKHSNRIATECFDRGSVDKDYRRENSKSISKQRFENIDCDTRISNIDKINDKIKKILEKCPEVRNSQNPYPSKERQYRPSLTPTKPYPTQQNTTTKVDRSPLSSHHPNDQSLSKPGSGLLKRDENQRSRSCLGKDLKPKPVKQGDDKYSKIQQKLNRYNDRVSGLAEEKKKLNLDFKLNKPESSFARKQITKQSHVSSKSKSSYSKAQDGSWISQDKNKSRGKLPQVEIVLSHRSNQNDLQNEQIDQNCNTMSDYFPNNNQMHQQVSNDFNQPSFSEAIEEPTRTYFANQTNFESISNVQTKKFVKVLSEQAMLDEQFRLAKNWFVNSEISGEYEVLQSILEQRWREMTLEEIKADFSVNFEEDDPFYSYRPDQFVLEDLVNNYIICNKNWKEKVQGSWDIQLLSTEGLFERLDMQGKGNIALQDLVRIVNMQQGTFYRNRDMYLIFQRLMKQSTGSALTMEVFSSVLGTR